jgi:hypothetical protein
MARVRMVLKKKFIIYGALSLLLISSALFVFFKAKASSGIVNIRVCPDRIINNDFYGFGAETLPWLWTKENKEAGVNEDDIKLNLKRTKEMYLSITRIFVPWETWNPSVDYKTFSWESDKMASLYRVLDFYQENGTKVILVTVDWLEDSPWRNAQASAQAVLSLLEYLIKEKGYSCIQFWTLTNEPELTYGWLDKLTFEDYIQVHKFVRKGLEERKLSVKIIASDEVESQAWFEKSVQSLYGVVDIFSSHAYLYPQQISSARDFFKKHLSVIRNVSLEKEKIPFFLCEFGFRGPDFGVRTNSLMEEYEYGLYVADLCIEMLNAGVDSASLWCLHQIRLINEIRPEGGKMMRIGMWAYKDKEWRPFPIFYLYRLFTKYIKPDSIVLKVKVSRPKILKAACVKQGSNYSLFVTNLTDSEQEFLIKGLDSTTNFKKYIYSRENLPLDGKTPLEIKNQIKQGGSLKDTIPPKSVVLYTDWER